MFGDELVRRMPGTLGTLAGARRHHHVLGLESALRGGDHEPIALLREPIHRDAGAHGEVEAPDVLLQVVAHLVLGRERPGRSPGTRMPGRRSKRAGVNRRSESQRVRHASPTRSPASRISERAAPLLQEVPGGQARLPAADDHASRRAPFPAVLIAPLRSCRRSDRATVGRRAAGGSSPEPANVGEARVVRNAPRGARRRQARPCSKAKAVAPDREETSSFANMFWRCRATVCSLITSSVAMSRFDLPAATRRNTSASLRREAPREGILRRQDPAAVRASGAAPRRSNADTAARSSSCGVILVAGRAEREPVSASAPGRLVREP